MSIFAEAKKRIDPEEALKALGIPYTHEAKQLLFRCPTPGHEDNDPSCFMARAPPGVWGCMSCGATGSTVDLWVHSTGKSLAQCVDPIAEAAGLDPADFDSAEYDQRPSELVAQYDYRDRAGRHVYAVERWEPGVKQPGKKRKSKSFSWRLPDGKSKAPPKDDLVLYGMDCILSAEAGDTVFLVEGEKACNAARKIGVRAVTWPSGGAAWCKVPEAMWRLLSGLDVVLLPDNDGVGQKTMHDLSRYLGTLGIEARRGLLLGLPPKGDVHDWVEAGGDRRGLGECAELAVPFDDGSWRDSLKLNRQNEIMGTLSNATLILENDPACKGILRKNLVGNVIEVCRRPPWRHNVSAYPRPLEDADVLAIAAWFGSRGEDELSMNSGAVLEAVQLCAHLCEMDPIRDYLDGLKWDGVSRTATFATEYLNAADENDVELMDILAEMWLMSGAKRGTQPGSKVDTVLVLEGHQGRKKSTALAVLGGQWFTDQIKDIDSKDTQMLACQTWIAEIPELDAFNKKEINAIKAWASAETEKFRPPYGKAFITSPRRMVVAGTTNADVYLRDATGDRRFWPCHVGSTIDLSKLRRDRDQLWAEALAKVRRGEPHFFDVGSELDERLLRLQEPRIEQDPWFDAVSKYAYGLSGLIVSDALREIGVNLERMERKHSFRVTSLFKRLGFTESKVRTIDCKRVRVYHKPVVLDQYGAEK